MSATDDDSTKSWIIRLSLNDNGFCRMPTTSYTMDNSTPPFDPIPTTQRDETLLQDALAFIGDLDFGETDTSSNDRFFAFLQECSSDTSASCSPERPNGEDVVQQLPLERVELQSPVVSAEVAPSTPSPLTLAWPVATMAPTKKSRTKRRDELLHLRSVVGHLENQLLELKRSANEEQAAKGGHNKRGNDGASDLVMAAWENIAARQQEQRQQSERENLRLKRILEDQIKVGRSLENLLLRKRPKMESFSPSTVEMNGSHTSSPCAWNEELIFDDLTKSIDAAFTKTVDSMAKVAHQCPSANHHDVAIVYDEVTGMGLQSYECRVFPFSYASVSEELWNATPEVPRDKIKDFHCTERSENLSKTHFKVNAFVGPVYGEIHTYFASRRFVEAHRTVVVSCAIFTPVKLADTDMDGISMRYTNWTILEALATTPNRLATKLSTRMTVTPQAWKPVDDQKRKIGVFTNFLLSAMSVEMESGHQILENRLFSRSATEGV